MRLLILRHAKAEKGTPGMRDRDRPLNPRGRKDAAHMGAYMAHHGFVPDRVLLSPSQRTRETWHGLALPGTAAIDIEDRLYNADAGAILTLLRDTPAGTRGVLVVGHNPGLHETAALLIAAGDVEARERLHEGLPTCGLAVIDFAGDDWAKLHPHSGRLERFVTPRLLQAATD